MKWHDLTARGHVYFLSEVEISSTNQNHAKGLVYEPWFALRSKREKVSEMWKLTARAGITIICLLWCWVFAPISFLLMSNTQWYFVWRTSILVLAHSPYSYDERQGRKSGAFQALIPIKDISVRFKGGHWYLNLLPNIYSAYRSAWNRVLCSRCRLRNPDYPDNWSSNDRFPMWHLRKSFPRLSLLHTTTVDLECPHTIWSQELLMIRRLRFGNIDHPRWNQLLLYFILQVGVLVS